VVNVIIHFDQPAAAQGAAVTTAVIETCVHSITSQYPHLQDLSIYLKPSLCSSRCTTIVCPHTGHNPDKYFVVFHPIRPDAAPLCRLTCTERLFSLVFCIFSHQQSAGRKMQTP